MKWISIEKELPQHEGYYKCMCWGFGNILRCKFQKEKKSRKIWSPYHFIYKKRCPFVQFWRKE